MDHRVDRQREAELAHPASNPALLQGAVPVARDALGVGGSGVLDRELDVVEPAFGEPSEPLARQGHARGDEIGIEAGGDGGLQDLLEILAHCWLTAGEVNLQHAERAGLAHHVLPLRRRQLGIAAPHVDRVGAIGTLQGTTVGELREQADRRARTGRLCRLDSFQRFELHARTHVVVCVSLAHASRYAPGGIMAGST